MAFSPKSNWWDLFFQYIAIVTTDITAIIIIIIIISAGFLKNN